MHLSDSTVTSSWILCGFWPWRREADVGDAMPGQCLPLVGPSSDSQGWVLMLCMGGLAAMLCTLYGVSSQHCKE